MMPYIAPDYFRREMLSELESVHNISSNSVFWKAHIRHTADRLKKAHPVVPDSSTYRGGGRNLKRGLGFQFLGCLELLVRMPVAVPRPFGSRGTVQTPIARSHSMPSRARRRRPPHGTLVPHIGRPGTTG